MKVFRLLVLLIFISVYNLYAKKTNNELDTWEKNIRSIITENPHQAIVLSDSLLKIGNKLNNDEYISNAYYFLGVANYYIGRNYLSNELYKKALNTSFAESNPEFQGKCWNNMGINFDIMDKNADAIDSYLKSLKVSEQLKDSFGIAQSWINVGLLDSKVSNFTRSKIFLLKALKYFESKKDTFNIALCYQNIAIDFNYRNHTDSAIAYFKKSYNFFEQIDHKYGIAQNSYNLGLRYLDKGDLVLTEKYLLESLEVARQIEIFSLEANIYLHLADFHKNNRSKNLYYTQLAQELFEQTGDQEKSMTTHLLLCDMYANSGDLDNYHKSMETYKSKLNDLTHKNTIERYEEFQAIYESEAKQNIILQQDRKLEKRNTLLVISGVIILLLIIFIAIVYNLMLKMRKYMRALYKKNVDLRNANILSISSKISDDEEQSDLTKPTELISEEKKSNEPLVLKMTELYQEIIHLFETEKLYLKHDLSVSELSTKLNTNDKYISVAINNNSQSNFNNLVNAFRINEAKNLIAEYGKSINIKELADRSGYKSLNTFYKNFKENTGLTPSQYIELSEDQELN